MQSDLDLDDPVVEYDLWLAQLPPEHLLAFHERLASNMLRAIAALERQIDQAGTGQQFELGPRGDSPGEAAADHVFYAMAANWLGASVDVGRAR